MPVLHVASHLLRFGWSAIRHPRQLYGRLTGLASSWQRSGFRSTAGRVSDRLPFWLAASEVDDCPICNWVRDRDAKALAWQTTFRRPESWLDRLRQVRWPDDAPTFTVVMRVRNAPSPWLAQALASVRSQIYPKWELICVDDGSDEQEVGLLLADASAADPRIKTVALSERRGVGAAANVALQQATGDYICLLGQNDALEPHALHRLADAIGRDHADLLYSDELVCGEDLETVLRVAARPQFSYDHYLSHPYFVHLIAVRTALAQAIDGFDETMTAAHEVDFVLRVLERAAWVTHVPDVLYRWRTVASSNGDSRHAAVEDSTTSAIRRHLSRIGCNATVTPTFPDIRDVAFVPSGPTKVAIIIPTRNRTDLLHACLISIQRTVPQDIADVVVVDHQSDSVDDQRYLSELGATHRVLSYCGPFNYSAMMNDAVRRIPGTYSHYLFLNNDIEATSMGWLEHMLGLGHREDVAAVGATLLYPDGRIQHGGVVVGLNGGADHMGKHVPNWQPNGSRTMGHNAMLVSNREVSAVTAACMLFSSRAFKRLAGFDESLAVGFGDTDLCLRAIGAGYKVLMDANVSLIHHESGTRGKFTRNPHPKDSRRFIKRWRAMIRVGDPRYTPFLSLDNSEMQLKVTGGPPIAVHPRTVALTWPGRRPDQN